MSQKQYKQYIEIQISTLAGEKEIWDTDYRTAICKIFKEINDAVM